MPYERGRCKWQWNMARFWPSTSIAGPLGAFSGDSRIADPRCLAVDPYGWSLSQQLLLPFPQELAQAVLTTTEHYLRMLLAYLKRHALANRGTWGPSY